MTPTAPAVATVPAVRASPPMGRTRALVSMTRPTQLMLIVAVFANGILLALWRDPALRFDVVTVLPALVLLLATAVAVHLCNESADAATDRLTARTPYSGGSGALEASGMAARTPLRIGLALAVVAGAGIGSAALAGLLSPTAAGLALAGLIGGLFYSLPPIAAMRRGWGEPLNALLGSLLLPLFGVATIAARIVLDDVIAFAPFLLVTFVSVMATAWPDRAADAATGKRTMQVRLPPAQLRLIATVTVVAFVAGTLVSAVTEAMPLALAGLLVLPLLLVGLRRYTRVSSPTANVAAMVGLTLLTTATLLISLAGVGGHA